MKADDVKTFRRCIAVGGVALFPTDTVYGLATDPHSSEGVDRLYGLKGRPQERPSAVMFFRLELALAALPELGERTRAALGRLLPGPVTVVLPNRAGASRSPAAPSPSASACGCRCSRASSPRCARPGWPGAPVERQPERRPRTPRAWPPWTRGSGPAWT